MGDHGYSQSSQRCWNRDCRIRPRQFDVRAREEKIVKAGKSRRVLLIGLQPAQNREVTFNTKDDQVHAYVPKVELNGGSLPAVVAVD